MRRCFADRVRLEVAGRSRQERGCGVSTSRSGCDLKEVALTLAPLAVASLLRLVLRTQPRPVTVTFNRTLAAPVN